VAADGQGKQQGNGDDGKFVTMPGPVAVGDQAGTTEQAGQQQQLIADDGQGIESAGGMAAAPEHDPGGDHDHGSGQPQADLTGKQGRGGQQLGCTGQGKGQHGGHQQTVQPPALMAGLKQAAGQPEGGDAGGRDEMAAQVAQGEAAPGQPVEQLPSQEQVEQER